MHPISFRYISPSDFSACAPALFAILHGNMTPIAPTGNPYEADFLHWSQAWEAELARRAERRIVLMEEHDTIIGFFSYACTDSTCHMEEVQLSSACQGRGILRRLYAFVLPHLPADLAHVEAYANKQNHRSITILTAMGLRITDPDTPASSYRFRGAFSDLLAWVHGSTERTMLLIDGHNLLFQMFFGMPARITNQAGEGIWGVIGFVGALRKIISRFQPTHLAVLFDGEHGHARAEIHPEYKSTRVDYSAVPEEESPFSQLPSIMRALEHLHIPYAETTDCEVDDWMAGYAARYGGVYRLILSSFDSDFFQLISPHVSVFRYRGEKSVLCDEAYLQNSCGVSPGQYADFKAMVGDTADAIRGVEKIGPKTAARLLADYGTLENLLTHAEELPQKAVREALMRSGERVRQNYEIIHLSGDVPLPIRPADMVYSAGAFSTNEVLSAIGLLP